MTAIAELNIPGLNEQATSNIRLPSLPNFREVFSRFGAISNRPNQEPIPYQSFAQQFGQFIIDKRVDIVKKARISEMGRSVYDSFELFVSQGLLKQRAKYYEHEKDKEKGLNRIRMKYTKKQGLLGRFIVDFVWDKDSQRMQQFSIMQSGLTDGGHMGQGGGMLFALAPKKVLKPEDLDIEGNPWYAFKQDGYITKILSDGRIQAIRPLKENDIPGDNQLVFKPIDSFTHHDTSSDINYYVYGFDFGTLKAGNIRFGFT